MQKIAQRGISFSPAGLLTPFHFGASCRLQELGLITSSTALVGASGGAIAAVMTSLFHYYEEQNLALTSLLPNPALTTNPSATSHTSRHVGQSSSTSGQSNTSTGMPFSASKHVESHQKSSQFVDYLTSSTPSWMNSSSQTLSPASSTPSLNSQQKKELLKHLSLVGSTYIAMQCRDYGSRGTLRHALDEVLDTILPSNIHDILNQRNAMCKLTYLGVNKRDVALETHATTSSRSLMSSLRHWISRHYSLQPHHIFEFHHKQDVIDVIRASCNIPFYLNGNNVFVDVRNHKAVDGALAGSIHRFYCPLTHATDSEILILPFHASRLNISAQKIMQRQQQRNPTNTCQVHVISIDDIQHLTTTWPFNTLEMIRMIIAPPFAPKNPLRKISNAELQEIYEVLFHAGEEAVNRWYNRIDGKI